MSDNEKIFYYTNDHRAGNDADAYAYEHGGQVVVNQDGDFVVVDED